MFQAAIVPITAALLSSSTVTTDHAPNGVRPSTMLVMQETEPFAVDAETVPGSSSRDENDGLPRPAFVRSIAQWISDEFGLPPIREEPAIRRLPASEMARQRDKIARAIGGASHAFPMLEESAGEKRSDLVGFYDDRTRTIYLTTAWSLDEPADVSVLVHEMVHHMQHEAGLKFECAQAREKTAFAAQQQWLALSGADLRSSFGLDPFTLLVRTSCLH